jgi:hypothetical protein
MIYYSILSKEERKQLCDSCEIRVHNSYKCQHCKLRNNSDRCFFAIECLTHNFSCFTDEEN